MGEAIPSTARSAYLCLRSILVQRVRPNHKDWLFATVAPGTGIEHSAYAGITYHFSKFSR
jgi:hypothetical protein